MENITEATFFILLIVAIFSPIYFQNRKLRKMMEADMRKLEADDRAYQLKWMFRSKLTSRLVLGIVLVLYPFVSLLSSQAISISPLTVLAFISGIGLIIYGFWSYRNDMRSLVCHTENLTENSKETD